MNRPARLPPPRPTIQIPPPFHCLLCGELRYVALSDSLVESGYQTTGATMDQEKIYPWDRRSIGAEQTWYTRAVRRWEKYLGLTGAAGWFCPKCNACPSYQSELPNQKCYDCGEQMAVREPGEGVTEITVRVTDYGFERLHIGPKRDGRLGSLPYNW